MNTGIPKRVIQIWGGGSELPLFSKAAVANIRLLNPDFEYMLFDDTGMEDFIKTHFPEYLSVFHSFRFPIQRYDFFRYLAIYHLGGFYFDTDVFLASGLSDLLNLGCVFPFEELNANFFLRQEYGMDWGIGNYAFGAAARHPFLRAIIENCIKAERDPEWAEAMMRSIPRIFHRENYVLNTTGPGLVARTLAEYPDAASQVKVLFPENVCDTMNWFNFGTLGVHIMKRAWREQGTLRRLRRRLYIMWLSRTMKKLHKESLKLGRSRSLEFRRKL